MLNMLIEEPITPEWLRKLLNNSSTLTSTQKVTATTTGSITTTQGSVFTPAAAEVVVTANLYHVTATSGKCLRITSLDFFQNKMTDMQLK